MSKKHLAWVLGLSLVGLNVSVAADKTPPQKPNKKATSVLDFKVKDINGKVVDLRKLKDRVLMVVNVASR